jgi:hypothetical protein
MTANRIIKVVFPSYSDLVPSVRKFISDAVLLEGYPSRFAFQTEVIVDELCQSAMQFNLGGGAEISFEFEFLPEGVEIRLQGAVARTEQVQKLRKAIEESRKVKHLLGGGMEIIQLLSTTMDVLGDEGNAQIRVFKGNE